MVTEREIDADLKDKKAEYDEFIKKWTKARDKWEEWERKRLDMENELTALGIELETAAFENNTWHDQRRPDFDPMKDGKRQLRLDTAHNVPYDFWEAAIQCPRCKRYNVKLRFKVGRAAKIAPTGDIYYASYDLEGVNGSALIDGYWYCKKCQSELEI